MKWFLPSILAGTVVSVALAAADAPAKPARPNPAIERVAILSIDGLRPDRLLLADAPNVHGLLRGGAYTFWARTTALAITLPSYTSMLTGVTPAKHGITWNGVMKFSEPVFSAHPTVFELAKRAGYTTAMIGGKAKFRYLAKPGTLDVADVPELDTRTDQDVGDRAVEVIRTRHPDLLMVHLPEADSVGHGKGWGSADQLRVIENADRQIGRILQAMEEAGVRRSTLIIISTDHGGQGRSHGADDERSRFIPWIANGPGVRAFYDLTQQADLAVRTEDTCATAAWALGIAPLPQWDGKPVLAAFEAPPSR